MPIRSRLQDGRRIHHLRYSIHRVCREPFRPLKSVSFISYPLLYRFIKYQPFWRFHRNGLKFHFLICTYNLKMNYCIIKIKTEVQNADI